MLRVYVLVVFAALAVSQAVGSALNGVEYDWESEPKKDYSGSQFDYRVCSAPNTYCDEPADKKRHVPIAHNCMAACRRDDTCHSAYWKQSNRYCYMYYQACDAGNLKARNGDVYFQRVHAGCPNGLNAYVTPDSVYGNEYCLTKGKKCPGDEMYTKENGDPNPWKHQTKQQCADRGNRILNLAEFDWVPHDDEANPDDDNAKGYCHYKVSSCTDDQLEDVENSYNYKRVPKGGSCSPEYCWAKNSWCYTNNGQLIGITVPALGDQQVKDLCIPACEANPDCDAMWVSRASSGFGDMCYLASIDAGRKPCTQKAIWYDEGMDLVMKKTGNMDCDDMSIWGSPDDTYRDDMEVEE